MIICACDGVSRRSVGTSLDAVNKWVFSRTPTSQRYTTPKLSSVGQSHVDKPEKKARETTMGLDQLRKSLEMKERIDPNGIDARSSSHLKHGKKPLMERCRRQKINNYLEELKCLVLSALNKEVSHYNKMEKADILDMAVKYIKAVRTTPPETPTIKYRQQREYSTSAVPRYQAASPSPLGAHSVNVNYNNLYRSSRGTQNGEMKENCTRRLERERLDGQNYFAEDTSTQNNVSKYSQESQSRMREIPLTKSLSCQTDNGAPMTQTSISTKIWRPW